jgi:DNA repair exonuclease SbcCD ATPase subunit
MIALLLALLAPSAAYKLSARAGVTPVQKVLEMMNEMLAKGEEEKAKEAALFEQYSAWCAEMQDEKETAIKEATDAIAKAHAHKLKMNADATELGDKVEELDTEAAVLSGDKKESTEVREMEHDDYEHVHEDTTDNIDNLGSAIKQLGEKAQDAPALLQTGSKLMPQSTKQLIASLMQENEQQPAQPEVKAFESSSGGILDTLGNLKGDLGEDREHMEVEESEERSGYNLQQDSLEGQIETDEDRSDDKSVTKAQKQEESAHDASDEAAISKQKAEDEKYLAELVAQCETKSNDFAARAQMRTEELGAVQQAIDIIASKSVSGSADKHLPSLVQRRSRSLALRASASARTQAAANLLKRAAAKTRSKTLNRAVAVVQEGGHFDKIIQMIKDMIAQLTEQAGEEADHKAWCDEELKNNKNTRDGKTSDVNSLTASKEKLEAKISSLTEQVSELSAAVAELDAAMSEATTQRQKEHDQNTEAISDAKEAQAAVKTALGVLEGFYAKAAKATALAQGPAKDAPASFSKPYTGMGQGKGVIGMLEVILSDFVRLEQETSSEEAESKSAFDEFSSISTEDKDAKTESVKTKKHTIIKSNHALAQTKKDLAGTQTELDGAITYYEKLKPDCLDAGVDYAERGQRRQEEISSLQDALKLLGED